MPLTCRFLGGDKGVRTPDLMTASHALSQLSYIPVSNDATMIIPITPRGARSNFASDSRGAGQRFDTRARSFVHVLKMER